MTAPLLVMLIGVYIVGILGIVAADSTLKPPRGPRDLRPEPIDGASEGDELLPADR